MHVVIATFVHDATTTSDSRERPLTDRVHASREVDHESAPVKDRDRAPTARAPYTCWSRRPCPAEASVRVQNRSARTSGGG